MEKIDVEAKKQKSELRAQSSDLERAEDFQTVEWLTVLSVSMHQRDSSLNKLVVWKASGLRSIQGQRLPVSLKECMAAATSSQFFLIYFSV